MIRFRIISSTQVLPTIINMFLVLHTNLSKNLLINKRKYSPKLKINCGLKLISSKERIQDLVKI
mgnify:CR=1 FL=1